MLVILYAQLITTLTLITLVRFKSYFSNMFWLVSSGVLLAFIPNFLTSLLINQEMITFNQAQYLFSITGGIVLTFLYVILSKIKCN